jgi:hypothetical protein
VSRVNYPLWIAVVLIVLLVVLVASCSPPLVRVETTCVPAPDQTERT